MGGVLGSWLMGQACTTPVQGLKQEATCAPRGALGGMVGCWPPVRAACFLRLRGGSKPPVLPPAGLAEEEVDDPVAGALLEAPADLVEARRAVEMAFCARLADERSS